MTLGIIYQDNKIINHRSLLKVICNPILRFFGFQIHTICNNGVLGGIGLSKCQRIKTIKWNSYQITDDMKVIRKRLLV